MPAALVDAFFEFFRGGTYDDSQVDDTAPRLLGAPCARSPTGPAPMRMPSGNRRPGRPPTRSYGDARGRAGARGPGLSGARTGATGRIGWTAP